MRADIHSSQFLRGALMTIFAAFLTTALRADEITDWNQILFQAAHAANSPSTVASRNAAIVEVSVFDAVNGIKGGYSSIHVAPGAPGGSSARAAAVQAAYANLVRLYPTELSTFDAARTASLQAILNARCGSRSEPRCSRAVDDGIAWGQEVADAIYAWRSNDGFTPAPPPFLGGTSVGEWRPTPPAFAPGSGPQFAYMTPWVIAFPSMFRPDGPPALQSIRYAENVNESKFMGSLTSTLRTADQTAYAQFWATSTPIYNWNGVALSLSAERNMTLLGNARLFAELNVAMADAAIAIWEAKYYYVSWRPITAITLADTDDNPLTAADPNWIPLIVTPNHPEYPAAHSGFSSAGATVLAHIFGEDRPFVVTSDALPGTVRSFQSFDAALDEIANARIYGGLHFRTSCNDGRLTGTAVAKYIIENAFQRLRAGEDDDDEQNHN